MLVLVSHVLSIKRWIRDSLHGRKRAVYLHPVVVVGCKVFFLQAPTAEREAVLRDDILRQRAVSMNKIDRLAFFQSGFNLANH